MREAFIRSVNVDAGVESLFFGTAERSYSALSSVEPMGYSDPDAFGYDPNAAARLLDGAGWDRRDAEGYRTKDGTRLTLRFPVSTNQSVPAEQSLFQQMQATAKDAGFAIELDLLDLSSWYGALGKNDYNLVSAPYTKVGPDVLRILFHSDSTTPAPSGYFANHSQAKSPELDALLTKANRTTGKAEQPGPLRGRAEAGARGAPHPAALRPAEPLPLPARPERRGRHHRGGQPRLPRRLLRRVAGPLRSP